MRLAQITGKYIGRSFSECNCLGLIHDMYENFGIEFPTDYGHLHAGTNIGNYMDLFEADPKEAIRLMLELFKTLGQPIKTNRYKIGDLLAVRQPDGVVYPAVYVGFDQAISSFLETGVAVFRLDPANRVILARRFSKI